MAFKITLLTLPSVTMMMMMMMMMVAQAAPQKPQGKLSAHHKPETQEDSPKYYFMSLENEIKTVSHPARPIKNDSISPWEYIQTTDPNRIPFQLSEARCLLTGCLNSKGEETLDLESRRIFRQVPVLQRVRQDDKNYYFRLEYKTISVGCTCVRPYVEQIQG